MLNENIRALRKSHSLSQEELAARLHVVRQTISKWEQGLSVLDSDMLISLSEVLETPVSTLLGAPIAASDPDDWQVLSEKLESINVQLAQRKAVRKKALHWCFLSLCALVLIGFALLAISGSAYLAWDYSSPETAVIGVGLHSLEWLFVRLAPLTLIGGIVGAAVTRKK